MGRWWLRHKDPDPVLIINGTARKVSDIRLHAMNVAANDWETGVERGLAITLIAALDELMHEGGPIMHEVTCPQCGGTIRARMADK